MSTPQAVAVVLYTTPPQAVVAQQWTDTTKGDQITIARITSITSTYAIDTSVQPLMITAMVQSLVRQNLTYPLLANQWVVVGPNFEQAMDDATFKALYTVVGSGTHAIAAVVGADASGPLTANLRLYTNFTGSVTVTWGDGGTDTVAVTSGVLATATHAYAAAATYTIVAKEVSGTAAAGLTYAAYAAAVSPMIDVQSSAQSSDQDAFTDATPPGTVTSASPMAMAFESGMPMPDMDVYTGSGTEATLAPAIETVGQWSDDELARIEAGLPPVESGGA